MDRLPALIMDRRPALMDRLPAFFGNFSYDFPMIFLVQAWSHPLRGQGFQKTLLRRTREVEERPDHPVSGLRRPWVMTWPPW